LIAAVRRLGCFAGGGYEEGFWQGGFSTLFTLTMRFTFLRRNTCMGPVFPNQSIFILVCDQITQFYTKIILKKSFFPALIVKAACVLVCDGNYFRMRTIKIDLKLVACPRSLWLRYYDTSLKDITYPAFYTLRMRLMVFAHFFRCLADCTVSISVNIYF